MKISNVTLTIPERVALLNVLPEQGSIVTLRTIGAFRKKLAFAPDEIKKWKITQKEMPRGLMVVWDPKFADIGVNFDISDAEYSLVFVQLTRLSDEGLLRMEMLSLYDKFVENDNQEKKVKD